MEQLEQGEMQEPPEREWEWALPGPGHMESSPPHPCWGWVTGTQTPSCVFGSSLMAPLFGWVGGAPGWEGGKGAGGTYKNIEPITHQQDSSYRSWCGGGAGW